MKKKKSDNKNSGSTASALRPLIIYSSAVLLVTLLCAVIINFVQLRAENRHQLERLSDHQVQNYAIALAQFIQSQKHYLRSLAQDPDILRAIRERESLTLRTMESRYTTAYPYANQIHIIPLGALGTAAKDFPDNRLNSIETAMIIDASRGVSVPPETYRKGPQNVISILQSVGQTADHIEGVILLSLDSQSMVKVMNGLVQNQGELTLSQRVGNERINMFKVGRGSASSPAVHFGIPGANKWELTFRGSEILVDAARANSLLSWLVPIVAGLLLFGYGLMVYRTLQRHLNQEFQQLNYYLTQLNNGERALPPALQIKQLTDIGTLAFDISQKPPVSGKPTQSDADATAQLSEKMSGKKAITPAAQGIETEEIEASRPASAAPPKRPDIAAGIFRAYDIRGIVGEDLTNEAMYQIGQAVGSEAHSKGENAVLVARDGRLSSEELAQQVMAGIQASGMDVIDLGSAPTPVLYFGTHQLNTSSGVMITGSHNPPEYNGVKVVIAGQALFGDGIQGLRQRILQGLLNQGEGNYNTADLVDQYIDYVLGDIAVAQPLKLVIDCGNGIAGKIAPRLFEDLGCEVVPLYCEVDGTFPNHHPDPSVPENLADLTERVRAERADLGIAFDGDGDRLGVVSAAGEIIPADHLLMLFAQDVVSRNPGCDVIYDVKCTRHLNDVIASYGGRPVMWKSGHSMIKQKKHDTGALLGGEFSGHIFFKERWFGFDDGLYSAARLIEIMSTTNPDLDQLLEQFPKPLNTPEIQLEVGEERKFQMIENIANGADFGSAKVTRIDGIRVELPDGWGLIRASNTTPKLVLRFEAENADAMNHIKGLFTSELNRLEPGLKTAF